MSFPPPTKAYPDVCAATTADLIAAYRASIDMLRASCKAEIEQHKLVEKADPNFGDDIFLLRFVLSHHKKGLAKAKAFLLQTIQWRAKHKDILPALRLDLAAPQNDDTLRRYLPGGFHYCTNDGHPVFIVRNGVASPHATMRAAGVGAGGKGMLGPFDNEANQKRVAAAKCMTAQELCDWMVLTKECGHAYCDAKTRQLGRLIKCVAIQDFRGSSMRNFNRHFMSGLTSSSHTCEAIYPQLLKRSLIVHMPMLLRKMTFLTLKLMPQNLQEKVGICPETEPKKVAAYIAKEYNIPAHDLPTFLGGECQCDPTLHNGGCCNNTPNAWSHTMTDAEGRALPMQPWTEYVRTRVGQGYVSRTRGLPWRYNLLDGENDKKEAIFSPERGGYISTLDAERFTKLCELTRQKNGDAALPLPAPSETCAMDEEAIAGDGEAVAADYVEDTGITLAEEVAAEEGVLAAEINKLADESAAVAEAEEAVVEGNADEPVIPPADGVPVAA